MNKMEKLMMLLLSCHVASAVKHSLKFYLMISAGVPDIPDFVGAARFDEVGMIYYDSNMKGPLPRHEWVGKLIEDDPQHWKMIAVDGIRYQQLLKDETVSFKRNQTGGVHIIQQILGCEWDNETEKVDGCKKYGYNGEDFLAFDWGTETWIAANPQAEIVKREWDGNTASNGFWKNFITNICPVWLKKYLIYAKGPLNRAVLSSVSLLQKTPSSPVSCHATGFYPNKAMLVWRKNGEELHEDVDQGEILPNHDGTFQMSVDLNVSSAEDWGRYDCVFHLSGVEDDIVTKLDKAVIRTNWGKTEIRNDEQKPSDMTVPIVVAVLVLVALVISVLGFIVYKKKAKQPSPAPDNTCELTEKLNPDT